LGALDGLKLLALLALFQRLQAQRRALHSGHFLWPLHLFPFANVILGASTADAQLTTELAG
jgi:hypothetical protein